MKNELRIGNYINNYNKVIGIGEYILCEALSFSGMIFIEDPKPIPLTEEILLKCGFVEELDNYFLEIGQRITLVYFDRNECQFSILQDGKEIALKFGAVKYLHQLQNLYFALTNEELNVNL